MKKIEVRNSIGEYVKEIVVEDGEKLIAYVGDKEHLATVDEVTEVYNVLKAMCNEKINVVVLPPWVKLEKIKFIEGDKKWKSEKDL